MVKDIGEGGLKKEGGGWGKHLLSNQNVGFFYFSLYLFKSIAVVQELVNG